MFLALQGRLCLTSSVPKKIEKFPRSQQTNKQQTNKGLPTHHPYTTTIAPFASLSSLTRRPSPCPASYRAVMGVCSTHHHLRASTTKQGDHQIHSLSYC